MPYNGSGTFTLVTGNPVVTGTVINSTVHNNTNNDIASGLTNSLTRDGQSVPFGNLPMGGFKHTGAADASVAGQYVTYGQVFSGGLPLFVAKDDLADTSDVAKGDALVGVKQPFAGAIARTQHDKNAELLSASDFSTVQQALDQKYGAIESQFYDITEAVKFPNLSRFTARRPGGALIGTTPNDKHGIRKTTNNLVAITNFQSSIVTNVDAISYTDPLWVDNGVSFPQKVVLENINFVGNSTPNNSAIYIEQGGFHTFSNISYSRVLHGIYAKECWSSTLENVIGLAKITWKGGTSITMTGCNTGSGPGSSGGFDLTSLVYSTLNSCSADGCTNTGFRFAFSKLTLNSCGTEGCTTITANSGTSIAFDGGNEVVLNDYVCVPVTGQSVAIFTVGANDQITFNQGCSSFGVPGLTCPDVYVHGNGATVIFNDYRFRSGGTNNPVVQFATGVATSVVIVRSGTSETVYTSDGTGALITRSRDSDAAFTPIIRFGATAATLTGSGTYSERGRVAYITGTAQLSSKNGGTGVATLRGWPTNRPTLGPIEIHFAVVTGIVGGPINATIASGGTAATFNVRAATGDSNATDANFTNTTLVWFDASWPLAI